MFSQGIYYKFGKDVFNILIAKRLPLFILGVIVVVPLSIVLKGTINNIAIYSTVFLLVFAGLLALDAWYQYTSNQFMLDEFSVHVRTGIFNRKEIAIPYRQIQDVSLEESYIERMFGVVELSVFTAGHENIAPGKDESSAAFFPLIDHNYAVELQQELLRRSNVQEIIHHGEDNISTTIASKI